MASTHGANIFGCDIARTIALHAAAASPPQTWSCWLGESPSPQVLQSVRRFYEENGFGSDWTSEMLACGAEAIVLLETAPADASTEPPRCIAAGFLTGDDFYVAEIHRTLRLSSSAHDPQNAADYYFGDWVAPDYRGRHLQRWLIDQRLARSAQRHRRWAYSITSTDNAASIRSYAASGFEVVVRITSRRWRGWQLDRLQDFSRPSGPPGIAILSAEGCRLPGGFRLRRW